MTFVTVVAVEGAVCLLVLPWSLLEQVGASLGELSLVVVHLTFSYGKIVQLMFRKFSSDDRINILTTRIFCNLVNARNKHFLKMIYQYGAQKIFNDLSRENIYSSQRYNMPSH